MGWMNIGYAAEPQTADGMLAEAIKRDVCGRLEQGLNDDAVIAEYLAESSSGLSVVIEVLIDRELGPGSQMLQLGLPDDQPFAAAIGAPAVAAMLMSIRRKVERAGDRELGELVFEVVMNPERIALRGA